ncbi:MAG: gamma-glutamylcyclotransferase [Lachnospiraceae bacterium]|nr:gamma-glutamylcyclotransferase [Lachnospiraceae bacterium]
MSKYYLAYGSNLSMTQMAERCPDAVYVGTAVLQDYRLLFKGSRTGSYLTVEPKSGSTVPVVVWKISEPDEFRLDRYEGCPNFYYKTEMTVSVHSLLDGSCMGDVTALIYIMHEERKLGCPTLHYFDVCLEGYGRFGFDHKLLFKALSDSVGKKLGRQMLREVGYVE